MPPSSRTFYVTTPIYYVNARPHIGHAYTTLVADVLARRHRLLGEDVFFLTGTDEHGQKIERSAAAAGIAPQQFADEVSASFEGLWKRMGITNDAFIRTTSEAHKRGAQKLFATLFDKGEIYLSSYTGQYSIGEEMFVEGPPGTIGPDGKPTETVTEENFFFRLGKYQLDLLDLIESGELSITPEARKNEVLSFLRGNVSDAPETALSAAGIAYVPGALKDLSVSRSSFKWGIPVPEPAASLTEKPHVIYVWLDALANYITALGYGSDDESLFRKYWPANVHLVGKEIIRFHCVYWPAFLMAAGIDLPKAISAHGWLLFDDAKMSKSKGNIVRTETILDAFGTLCPPQSTKAQQDCFASDILRYYLLREIPFGQDGSFTFDALLTRYKADLTDGYGNSVNRTLTMIRSYFGGSIPTPRSHTDLSLPAREQAGPNTSDAYFYHPLTLHELAKNYFKRCEEYANGLEFGWALFYLNSAIASNDTILNYAKPWKKNLSDDSEKAIAADVLYFTAEAIRIYTALMHPYLPYATAAVWRQLGLGDIEEAARNGELRNLEWGGLKPGTKLGPLSPIFPRADKGLAQTMSDMEAQKNQPNTPLGANDAADAATPTASEFPQPPISSRLAEENFHTPATPADPSHPGAPPRSGTTAESSPGTSVAASAALTTERPGTPAHGSAVASGIFSAAHAGQNAPGAPADASPQIAIDDFAKVELRVAQVLLCERIPKADKLLRLEVDLGFERRQILSGIAEWYTPEDLIGRRIVVITNLAPRKMRGLESHGMLLAASSEGGRPALATFLDSDALPLGARLK